MSFSSRLLVRVKSRKLLLFRFLPVGVTLWLGIALSVAAFLLAERKEKARVHQDFEQRAIARATAVERSLKGCLATLANIRNFSMFSEQVDGREFSGFVRDFIGHEPGLRMIAWLPRVPAHQRALFEAAACEAGAGQFQIHRRTVKGDRDPAAQRPEHFPALFIEPRSTNEFMLGLDFAEDPVCAALFQDVRTTGRVLATGNFSLPASPSEEGFLVCLPVYESPGRDLHKNSPAQLRGFLIAFVHLAALVEQSLESLPAGGLDIAIFDDTDSSARQSLYFHASRSRGQANEIKSAAAQKMRLMRETSLQVAGRKWTMQFTPAPKFLASQNRWLGWAVLIGGMGLTGALAAYLLNALSAQARIERLVSERTTQLEREIIERTLAEQTLKEERASLARRVEERTLELTVANDELARAARLKDEFLAAMSHELRTPLNAVLGLSEALQEHVYGPMNPKQLQSLRTIEESGRHLLSLINDILDLSKIEAGKTQLQISSVGIDAVCQASLLLVKQSALKKSLAISCQNRCPVATFMADERRLKQILVNLLSNAVKFTPENGAIGLEVAADMAHSVVRFSVWDTGIGIALEQQERLFKPFVQLDSRLSRHYAGTGLGLALVRCMTELHGGHVALESSPDQGSRFTVTLPLTTTGAAAGDESTTRPAAAGVLRHALIIEDSVETADQLARYLGEWGVRATLQRDAVCSVKKAAELKPDLILLDLIFSGVSGWQVLRELKSNPMTMNIPIIIVSVEDDRQKGLAAGAADYLVKPVTRQQLEAALKKIHPLERGSQRETAAQEVPAGSEKALILVVDDNEANMTAVADYLQKQGYRVLNARDGAEALALAKHKRPRLILMDIQMPVMDGLEAIRHIRADASLTNTRIIALTALAMPGDRERCLAVGANDYFAKPVILKQLACAIESELMRGTLAKAC